MSKINSLSAALMASLISVATQAASFDCAKASSPVEKMICSDQELSDLDKKLSDLYRDEIQSAASPDLKETQRAWLKERNKCGDLACMKDRYRERITVLTPSSTPPQYKLPPLDGIKHGATKEVFDKLVKDYQSRLYQVATERDGSKADYMSGHCMDLLNALRNGTATYVAPKFITDDYSDARLEPYKQKYREWVQSLDDDWAQVPGANWFGGGIEPRSESLFRPTRNFALYEMDLDRDGKNEILFYGEFGVKDEWGAPGNNDTATPNNGNGYAFYKYTNKWLEAGMGGIYVPEEYDYQKNKHFENYTSVFLFNGKKYVAVSKLNSDYISTEIEELGLKKGTNDKNIYSDIVCEFKP